MKKDWGNIIESLFNKKILLEGNLIKSESASHSENIRETAEVFSDKWSRFNIDSTISDYEKVQKEWYLDLYGFKDENDLRSFLEKKRVILDAGCGLGYKAAWFATLSPGSLVLAMDISGSVYQASEYYRELDNLFFIRGDIADTGLSAGTVDYVNCDQVIHHTENPEQTFAHLAGLLAGGGDFACYVYARKALPRELLDEYFRENNGNYTREQLWELAEQLTTLGKTLSELNISIEVPDIPLLQIRGGNYNIQRFIYWNFLKCFWNDKISFQSNITTNFDWYAPAKAKRYTEKEFRMMVDENNLEIIHWHAEEACYSGRFRKSG